MLCLYQYVTYKRLGKKRRVKRQSVVLVLASKIEKDEERIGEEREGIFCLYQYVAVKQLGKKRRVERQGVAKLRRMKDGLGKKGKECC